MFLELSETKIFESLLDDSHDKQGRNARELERGKGNIGDTSKTEDTKFDNERKAGCQRPEYYEKNEGHSYAERSISDSSSSCNFFSVASSEVVF